MIRSISRSVRTYASEISLWIGFCSSVDRSPLGFHLPERCGPGFESPYTGAREIDVLRFLGLFRNGVSASKYLSAVRFLHECAGAPREQLDTKRIARAIEGKKKDTVAVERAPPLQRPIVLRLVSAAWERREHSTACKCVLAYTFGSRVADELMPLEWDGLGCGGHSSVTFFAARTGRDLMRIGLATRKNEPHGAELIRPCTCPPWSNEPLMCPVHTLQRYERLSGRSARTGRVFPGHLPKSMAESFQREIRYLGVQVLRIPGAHLWTLHGFRRGMAQDILDHGGSLADILHAGGWRSAAFLLYLQRAQVDEAAVLDCIFASDNPGSDSFSRIPREVREMMVPIPNGEHLGVSLGVAKRQIPALCAIGGHVRPPTQCMDPAAKRSKKEPKPLPGQVPLDAFFVSWGFSASGRSASG